MSHETEDMPMAGGGPPRHVLSHEGVDFSILNLAPGESTRFTDAAPDRDHVLFVLEGGVTVRIDDAVTFLDQEEAMHIPGGQPHLIAAHFRTGAKLLRVDLASDGIFAASDFPSPG